WVAASIAGCATLPLGLAVQWQALLVACLFLPLAFGLLGSFFSRDGRVTLRSHFAAFARDAASAGAQVAARVVLIAHDAWSMGDAIVRTLHRLLSSRRWLLEWRTASQDARSSERGLAEHYRAMAGVLPVAAAALVIPLA